MLEEKPRKVTGEELTEWQVRNPRWNTVEVEDIGRVVRVYTFPDFAHALAFTNKVGTLAEEAGHHPALLTEWGKVTVSWWTHDIGGLQPLDLAMAGKTDQLYK